LLESKADINACNSKGDNLFNIVAFCFDMSYIKLLFSLGLNPKQENNDGWSFYEICKSLEKKEILSHFESDFAKYETVKSSNPNPKKNKQEIEKCFCESKCTLAYTNTLEGNDRFVHQAFFHCIDCFPGVDEKHHGVCISCAKSCHKDHELGPAKFSSFYCDCPTCGKIY